MKGFMFWHIKFLESAEKASGELGYKEIKGRFMAYTSI